MDEIDGRGCEWVHLVCVVTLGVTVPFVQSHNCLISLSHG